MTDQLAASPIDAHIAGFPPATQTLLRDMRALIQAEAPAAVETVSYGIPTFDLYGRHLVHFAGSTHHVGFYPTPSAMTAFAAELADYKTGKGSVQFPLDQELPADLIRRMVAFRVDEVTRSPRRR